MRILALAKMLNSAEGCPGVLIGLGERPGAGVATSGARHAGVACRPTVSDDSRNTCAQPVSQRRAPARWQRDARHSLPQRVSTGQYCSGAHSYLYLIFTFTINYQHTFKKYMPFTALFKITTLRAHIDQEQCPRLRTFICRMHHPISCFIDVSKQLCKIFASLTVYIKK